MIFVKMARIIKFGLLNFWRNKWLSLGSVLVLTLTLITVTVSVIENYDIKRTTEAIKNKLDIIVYFNDSVDEEEINNIKLKLEARSDVKEVKYISKEKALQKWKELPSSKNIKELVTPQSNPLPRSLQIKTNRSQEIAQVTELFKTPDMKDKVRRISSEDNKKFIQDLISRNRILVQNGLVSSLTFLIISLVVIINTVRIIILSRKEEIEIMRLVGASDVFIKMPFVIESLIIGLLSAVLSTGFLFIAIRYNVQIIPLFVSQYFSGVTSSIEAIVLSNIWSIFFAQALFAFLLLIITTFLSLRKYLAS